MRGRGRHARGRAIRQARGKSNPVGVASWGAWAARRDARRRGAHATRQRAQGTRCMPAPLALHTWPRWSTTPAQPQPAPWRRARPGRGRMRPPPPRGLEDSPGHRPRLLVITGPGCSVHRDGLQNGHETGPACSAAARAGPGRTPAPGRRAAGAGSWCWLQLPGSDAGKLAPRPWQQAAHAHAYTHTHTGTI